MHFYRLLRQSFVPAIAHYKENVSHNPWRWPMLVEGLPSITFACKYFPPFLKINLNVIAHVNVAHSKYELQAQNIMSAPQFPTLHPEEYT